MSRVFTSWRFLWDRRARRELTGFQRFFLALQGTFLLFGIPLIWWAASISCAPGDGRCTAESWGRGLYVVLFAGVWLFATSVILIGRAVAEIGQAVRSRRAAASEGPGVPAHPADSATGKGGVGAGDPPVGGDHEP